MESEEAEAGAATVSGSGGTEAGAGAPTDPGAVDPAAADVSGAHGLLSEVGLDGPAAELIVNGGPVVWIIAGLSVLALALTLWKLWRFAVLGAWRRARAEQALEEWTQGLEAEARATALGGRGVVTRTVAAAIDAQLRGMSEEKAREETARVAKGQLADLRVGLRGLEVIVTIAPLLGLLGTVLGMIEAFQALQAAGARADPSALAGGIWEALLTTAAGMGVAIPAGVALTYCESVVERVRISMEDAAARVFAGRREPAARLRAAE